MIALAGNVAVLVALGAAVAIVVSSVAFGILHVDPVGAGVFGAMTALLYLRTGSLWPAIGAHWGWNWALAFLGKVEAGEFDRRIEALGGCSNAATGFDDVHYHVLIPPQEAGEALAKRLGKPILAEGPDGVGKTEQGKA